MINKTEEEITQNWTTHKNPFVSCLTTTYNQEKYIAQCLDSMLMQETDFPFEIIVRDDCSTDRTASIVKEYVDKFPNIIKPIFEKENKFHISPHYGGRLVLKKATGKYVCKLDGDDYWRDKQKLQKQAEFLEENNAYVLSHFNSITVDENDKKLSDAMFSNSRDYEPEQMLCSQVNIMPNTVMFRNILGDFPAVFDDVMNGDNVHWHLLGFHGKSKYQEEIIPSAYRVHSGGVWSKLDKFEQFEKRRQSLRAMKKNLSGNTILIERIDGVIYSRFAVLLLEAIRSMDVTLFKKLIRYILEDEEINGLKVTKITSERLFKKYLPIKSDKRKEKRC